ncbi:amidohydrolase family protein [Staphylococcus caprae]|uniref:Amidohydrolase family protein n=1 Tax=Staphylococcus caprae TaxID=29380 RepID=A0ABM7FVU1_9STAP|nr:amidohydrolase family protein [Staphylococcus caprae]EES41181.1 amidohydrolase family protein [Staphylococcus caprae M23864:W1]MBN6826652.1 amidohydrolase family protein [Staphylococcus caprae]MBX5317317.1 amidohydrolase family protein [Staphylococcus caprae]MBX5323706.1 amidohydrolase family protein [Staphylococcus caprae]MDI0015235.1 amidohydrolase family protein [Staphylococcus caprae]
MKIFDAHFHMINFDYPVKENNGYLPPEFKEKDYKVWQEDLNIIGGAIVSGSFQEFDQEYLIHALETLNGQFVGTTQLPISTPDEVIKKLNELGIRGVRFNVKRGGSEDLKHLKSFAHRVYNLVGWHTELYIESKKLNEIKEILLELPLVSIDHLGLTNEGFEDLKELVEQGVYVKATGFGRIEVEPIQTMRELMDINPDVLMFGTDLPSTRAKRPFNKSDIELIKKHFSEEEQQKIFYKNAMRFYRINEI